MRHGSKNKHLSRTSSHRRALLKNLTISLFTHKAIVTTLAKAKALRKHVEPIMTKTKGISTQELMMARQRYVFSLLQHEDATKELFTVIAPKIADRPGGYCRIIKIGKRKGDASEMAYIELVDFNEVKNTPQVVQGEEGGVTTDKKKRTRRSSSKSSIQEKTNEIPFSQDAKPEESLTSNSHLTKVENTDENKQ